MTGYRAVQRRVTGDAGISLLELVVSMSIMSLVMVVFTTGVVAMYRSANRTEAMATAQQQVTVAFQRLDKEIRYASAISEPNGTGPDWYVEYLTTTSGAARCTELRLDRSDATNVRLRLRSWDQGSQPPAWKTSSVLASNLLDSGSASPFFPNNGTDFQRLQIKLQYSGGTAPTTQTNVTFTALNSDSTTASTYATVCTEGRAYS